MFPAKDKQTLYLKVTKRLYFWNLVHVTQTRMSAKLFLFHFIIFYLFIFVRKTILNEQDMKLEVKSSCVDLCTYLTCNFIYFFKDS